jgi:hypothetical protein
MAVDAPEPAMRRHVPARLLHQPIGAGGPARADYGKQKKARRTHPSAGQEDTMHFEL